jgi:quercetin dioxygenase-like cupin family protein
MGDSSKVIGFRGFRWDAVPLEQYKSDPEAFEGVTRQVLLGSRPGEEPLNFELRYFEVEQGGYTTLERHRHAHAVVVLRGKGTVVLGAEETEIQAHDCVYIPPGVVHQLRADREATLGFLCVVDRLRDRAMPVRRDGSGM